MRYPQPLLEEVIQTLTAALQLPPALGGTQALPQPGFYSQVGGVTVPQYQLASAAKLGLGVGLRTQPPSPVSKQALARALRYRVFDFSCGPRAWEVRLAATKPRLVTGPPSSSFSA